MCTRRRLLLRIQGKLCWTCQTSAMAYRHQAKYTRGEGEDQPPSLSVRDVVGRSYNESYVAARTNFVPQKARSSHRPIDSQQAFNMKRTENLSITRG